MVKVTSPEGNNLALANSNILTKESITNKKKKTAAIIVYIIIKILFP